MKFRLAIANMQPLSGLFMNAGTILIFQYICLMFNLLLSTVASNETATTKELWTRQLLNKGSATYYKTSSRSNVVYLEFIKRHIHKKSMNLLCSIFYRLFENSWTHRPTRQISGYYYCFNIQFPVLLMFDNCFLYL